MSRMIYSPILVPYVSDDLQFDPRTLCLNSVCVRNMKLSKVTSPLLSQLEVSWHSIHNIIFIFPPVFFLFGVCVSSLLKKTKYIDNVEKYSLPLQIRIPVWYPLKCVD